jgi:hypothetical protein
MREAQQKEAERMRVAQQKEAERIRAERDIAMGESKQVMKARWEQEYSEEGQDSKEELKRKINKIPTGELETRVSNQERENDLLHEKIDTLQNSLRTCYPDGENIIQNAKLTDLRDKLYTLKNQGQTLLTEREMLKEMFYATENCKTQKKDRFQDALTGDEPIVEPTSEESIRQVTALTPPPEEIPGVSNEIAPNEVESYEVESDDEVYITANPSSMTEPKTPRGLSKGPGYTKEEAKIDELYNIIKKYVVELIESNQCKMMYEKPDKFYDVLKSRALDVFVTGNFFAKKTLILGINLFLSTYPDIKRTIINTLKDTERTKSFCDSVSEGSDTDVIKLTEVFTDQLIVSIMNKLIEKYSTNEDLKDKIVLVQNTYYSYMEKRTIYTWEMKELERNELTSGGKHKKLIKRRKTCKGKRTCKGKNKTCKCKNKTCKGKKRVCKGKGKTTCKGKKTTCKGKKRMS